MDGNTHDGARRGPGVAGLAALTVVAVAVAAVAWWWQRAPADGSPEVGFARDMATHHDQAVEMSFILRDVTTDPRLRALTYDIIVTQTAQRGMFMAWLQQWGVPQASTGPRMSWMPDHAHHTSMGSDGLMPGMASAREMEKLRAARSPETEILFLRLMTRHHEGGLQMARALITRSTNERVLAMARSIDASQTAEIAAMKELLAERGAEPLPTILE